MSEIQRKKPVGRQPLTSHPLFPAIVALWFGALFGLGSLAIRPALIEQMVVAGGIDSVIPMAAPPLGVTTRILLALAMTGLGGLIGALIARQLSRPKQETRERRRAPRAAAVQETRAPTEGRPAASSSLRRRALAMEEDNRPAEPCDAAPVPGHSARILDVTEFELEGFEQLADDEPTAEDSETAHDEDECEPAFLVSESELELELDEPEIAPIEEAAPRATQFPADAQVFAPSMPAAANEPDQTEEELEDVRDMAPADLPEDAPATQGDRQVFDSPAQAENSQADSEAAFPAAPAQASRSSLNNRLFEAYSREIAARAERASDAEARPLFNRADAPAPRAHAQPQLLPRLALGEWGETEIDENNDAAPEHHEPLFPRTLSMKNEAVAPAEVGAAKEDVSASAFVGEARTDETGAVEAETYDTATPENEDRESAEPALKTRADEEAQEVQLPEAMLANEEDHDVPSAAERIASSELDELSPVELLERLAMSMARRRIRIEADPAAVQAPIASETEAKPFPNPWSDVLPVSAEFDDEDEIEDGDIVQAEQSEASDIAVADAPAEVPASVRPVPAALRPVSFEADGDGDELPGYVPPRSIGMPNTPEPNTSEPYSPEPQVDEIAFGHDEEDEDALEEGYSSLLNLSRPFDRPEFVRIDEPEASQEIQPFVVFPGEENRNRQEDASPVQDDAASDERPFDPPVSVDSRAEAEETERKLRAALANLQRISGAA